MTTVQRASESEFARYRIFTTTDQGPEGLTRSGLDSLLPDGLATKGQHLLSIRTQAATSVGFVWLTVIERKTGPEGFILDLVVYPEFRRQGHAARAMKEVEHYVMGLGLDTLSLTVFEENSAARSLYAELSFRPVFTRMTKRLNEIQS